MTELPWIAPTAADGAGAGTSDRSPHLRLFVPESPTVTSSIDGVERAVSYRVIERYALVLLSGTAMEESSHMEVGKPVRPLGVRPDGLGHIQMSHR